MTHRLLAAATATLAALALAPTLIQAQQRASDCREASTTAEMRRCAAEAHETADRELNAAYQETRRSLDDAGRRSLRAAQLAWIRFRDAHCAFDVRHAEGGTIQPVLQLMCLTGLTEERTAYLRRKLDDPS